MRKTQIEIYSNLEAYACLSYNAMTIKAIFQMKIKHIFRQRFRKTRFKMRSLVPVALFTSAKKTQSKSKFRRFVMVLLAFLRERTLLLLVFHQELHFICLLLHTSRRRFPANL